ncbi:MAG: hypothetical protein BZY88_05275 [SAR202 cluster bacterium Io17-Chloro-G9]|nr:MAG: hypothetical protein BZY88_05275 [SAR202 cluster bacterium Io17-Chloro-G9]
MTASQGKAKTPTSGPRVKHDADYIFHDLTRSICPECKGVIDAQIIIRQNKVYMRKRCPTHGWFEGIISADAEMYVDSIKFNKPGTIPLEFSTEVKDGCPLDCGLCPEHKQHICLGLIEVNTACNLNCPVCFANAGIGFSITLEQAEGMLDRFVETEGEPEVIQFSGGEPTIHPQLLDMIQAAKDRGIRQVMVNTNGVRIARDDKFLESLARLDPVIYFQFDGLRPETYLTIRGEDLLETKLKALDRLHQAGLDTVIVAAVEHGVNVDEVGALLEFGLQHPAVKGVVFQPVTHVGRHIPFDPMQRVTIPDVIHGIVEQTKGRFVLEDFVPVPCCFPTCQVNSYVFVDGKTTVPLPRMLDIDEYLDYITNRALPKAPDARRQDKAGPGGVMVGIGSGRDRKNRRPVPVRLRSRPGPGLRAFPLEGPHFPNRHQGFHGCLYIQRETGHEVLRGNSGTRRPDHSFLRLQLGGIPGDHPGAINPGAGNG